MKKIEIHTFSELISQGKTPEILFWVGCAGSFDDRAKKITKAFVKILNSINIEFAVLGTEESDCLFTYNTLTNFYRPRFYDI